MTLGGIVSIRRTPARQARQLTDEALVRLMQDDDPDAFGAFYDRHCDAAFGLARLICGDPAQAERVMSDAFCAAWRLRRRYDPARGTPRAWLLGLVRRCSLEQVRRSGPGRTLAEVPHGALTELAPLQREVITLAYFGGLSHIDIAERLKLPATSIKARMRQGLRALGGEGTPGGPPPDPEATLDRGGQPRRRAGLDAPRGRWR